MSKRSAELAGCGCLRNNLWDTVRTRGQISAEGYSRDQRAARSGKAGDTARGIPICRFVPDHWLRSLQGKRLLVGLKGCETLAGSNGSNPGVRDSRNLPMVAPRGSGGLPSLSPSGHRQLQPVRRDAGCRSASGVGRAAKGRARGKANLGGISRRKERLRAPTQPPPRMHAVVASSPVRKNVLSCAAFPRPRGPAVAGNMMQARECGKDPIEVRFVTRG